MKCLFTKIATFLMLFVSCFFLNARVQCSKCGQTFELGECKTIDPFEESFRESYQQHIYEYANNNHKKLFKKSSNTGKVLTTREFFEYYNNPLVAKLNFSQVLQTNDQLQEEVERAVTSKPLQYSIGTRLYSKKMRPDILNETSSGLKLFPSGLSLHCGFQFTDFGSHKNHCEYVCYKCLGLPKHLAPANFQLAMKIDQIIDRSDIVIILKDSHESIHDTVITYLQLFRNKKLVVGLRTYDTPDMTQAELRRVEKVIDDQFIEWDACNSVDKKLARVVVEYNLPLFNLDIYLTRELESVMLSDIALSCMVGKWCLNAVGFAMESPLAYLGSLGDKNYRETVKKYLSTLNAAFKELNMKGQNFLDLGLLQRKIIFGKKFSSRYKHSLTYRQEVAKKIASYFAAVNRSRMKSDRIPFLIVLDSCHGLKSDGLKSSNLIQNILQANLLGLELNSVRVTTVAIKKSLTDKSMLYSKLYNPVLEELCIDYLFFPCHTL
ncbi:hypothetical protein P0136_11190 [Lentisphaerota bacterium ZTH]|nr:hypothetical protein JYG24_11290 [Lentisphaerota bacterium]WET05923.1 hypothetical protein P0136_11190 [Lentisphaerota bacterium ZTH]